MKSNEKKQTAVEWLIQTIERNGFIMFATHDEIEQAKAMEKKQIEEALLTGLVLWDVDKPREQYYKETYEK